MSEAATGAPAGKQPLVSVVIVLFNSASYIEACLSSLAALDYAPLEVIIVDNGSTDGSARIARERSRREGLESCAISMLPRNRGFAKANNHGFALSRGEIILLLNPDTEVYPDMLARLVSAMEEDPAIGVAGCKVYYPDRLTIQHAGGYIRDNGLTMHFGADEPDRGQCDQQMDVHYVTGAAMAVRREVFTRAGMLDPGYFPAYFEETDLCLQACRMGYRVAYVPGARLVHHESTSTGKYSNRFLYLYHKNRIRFMVKNFSWRFLLDRALPMEQEWLSLVPPEEAVPLNKAYLVNVVNLPRTLLARRAMEKRLDAPRMEDTVSTLLQVAPNEVTNGVRS